MDQNLENKIKAMLTVVFHYLGVAQMNSSQ